MLFTLPRSIRQCTFQRKFLTKQSQGEIMIPGVSTGARYPTCADDVFNAETEGVSTEIGFYKAVT